MSVANEVHAGQVAAGQQSAADVRTAPWWQHRAVFRYGFLALILIVWQIVGPHISPIFFTYPSKIAVAFWQLTVSGDLPYYLVAEPGGDVLRPVGGHCGRHSGGGGDGARALARLGVGSADQRALRNPDGRAGADPGAVVRHLPQGQDHRRVPVRRVPDPDQYLSGRARVRQKHARGGAIVPLE